MARMNIAVKHMFRNRRQAEGRRPSEPYYPPGPDNYMQEAPLTFAYTKKQEAEQRTNLFIPPAFETNELVELPTSYKPDGELDPLPFSDEFANGLKIRPWAHVRVPSYLAVSEWEGVDNSDFENGWYQGKHQFGQLVMQYAGRQHPIDVSPLIPEAEYTTYGALNQLEAGQVGQYSMPAGDGYLFD